MTGVQTCALPISLDLICTSGLLCRLGCNLTALLSSEKIEIRIRVPVGEEMKNGYRKILRANIVSRKGRNEERVRKDIESEYGFPYWKK